MLDTLGGGGQGDVFRVVDETASFPGDYALKRLRDLRRIERFKNEIEALSRLDHPNVIKLIDHSGLNPGGDETRHYLVMPIAAERDAERRLPLFKGSIENTLRVGLQAANALQATHDKGIVHRDVKPANILFPNQSFDIWLTDFGICHLDKHIDDTPAGDVMGPRRFAAPEIEAGRAEEVPPGVDIYSLGQTLFYLLSNGRTFHREAVNATEYDQCFPSGEQSELLRALLSNMVTDRSTRLKTMTMVAERLEKIINWSQQVRSTPISSGVQSAILAIRQKIQQSNRQYDDAQRQRELQAAMRARILESIKTTIISHLTPAADLANDGGELIAEVRIIERSEFGLMLGRRHINLNFACELSLTKSVRRHTIERLQFWIGSERKINFASSTEGRTTSLSMEQMIAEDLSLVPLFLTTYEGAPQKHYSLIEPDGKPIPLIVDGYTLKINTSGGLSYGRSRPMQTEYTVSMYEFGLTERPENQNHLSSFVDAVLGKFVEQFLTSAA